MAKTIVQTKEEIRNIEREMNEFFSERIYKFESEFGVRLNVEFTGNGEHPFNIKFIGNSFVYGK
jgi:hypothetical protein